MTYKIIGRTWLDKCPKCGNPKREILSDGYDGLTVIVGCPKCGKTSRNIFYEEYLGEEEEE